MCHRSSKLFWGAEGFQGINSCQVPGLSLANVDQCLAKGHYCRGGTRNRGPCDQQSIDISTQHDMRGIFLASLGRISTHFEFHGILYIFILQVKLVQHTYSCLFGTFLCNSLKARLKNSIKERTCSVWSLIVVEGNKYRNFLYDPKTYKVSNWKTTQIFLVIQKGKWKLQYQIMEK